MSIYGKLKYLHENWINLLLIIPLLISSLFIFTNIILSTTISWSMLGIIIGFFISYSDSADELESLLTLFLYQTTLLGNMNLYIEAIIGVRLPKELEEVRKALRELKTNMERLAKKIAIINKKREIMKVLFILYFISSILTIIFSMVKIKI